MYCDDRRFRKEMFPNRAEQRGTRHYKRESGRCHRPQPSDVSVQNGMANRARTTGYCAGLGRETCTRLQNRQFLYSCKYVWSLTFGPGQWDDGRKTKQNFECIIPPATPVGGSGDALSLR